MDKNFDYCAQVVRENNKIYFLSTLFAPIELRRHLYALIAFYDEISKVRSKISEPLPGEVRLQWWRDIVNNAAEEIQNPNPIAAAISATIIECALPQQVLLNMIDAMTFDIYNDPMPSLNDFEGYAGETYGALIMLACIILKSGIVNKIGHLAGHAGCALTIVKCLQNLALHTHRGQVFLPCDILAHHNLTPQDILYFKCPPNINETKLTHIFHMLSAYGNKRKTIVFNKPNNYKAVQTVLETLIDRALFHVEQIKNERALVSGEVCPAFLPVALVREQVQKMKKQPLILFERSVDMCPLSQFLALWCTSRVAQ